MREGKSRYKVLVIEDNEQNLELMTYLLKAFGHEVACARDGREGISSASAHHPDVIICDLQLPVMSGYEVVEALKGSAELSRIPIVAVTALAMVGDRENVLAAGFDGYISKPIKPETFVDEIVGYAVRKRQQLEQTDGAKEEI